GRNHRDTEILKLDESCISDPKSEISDWTGDQRGTLGPSNLRFRISDLRCRIRPISKFPGPLPPPRTKVDWADEEKQTRKLTLVEGGLPRERHSMEELLDKLGGRPSHCDDDPGVR